MYRVCCNHALEKFGLDFAGSLYCGDDFPSTKNMYKCYILFFPCCVTWPVHLEVIADVNSANVILELRWFIARGMLCLLLSNDFKSFKSLDIKNKCCKQGISCKFILECSSWWDGFYKRLIVVVKSPLKKVLGKVYLTYLELYATLTEIKNIMNFRPLTYFNEYQFSESLTPKLFDLWSFLA